MMDIVEQIKEANLVQDVIGEMYPMHRRSGRYLKTQEHDSLVIDTVKQRYEWNSTGESGDVIQWVIERNGWEFKTAVEWLARRVNLPDPKWSKEDEEKRQVQRTRETAFEVALKIMQGWLQKDDEVMDYCHGRGWSDVTITDASVGFAGRATAGEYSEMRSEFDLHEIDTESPQAVCILGYKGDVRAWGEKWKSGILEHWIDWKMIPGLMGRKRLVYAHIYGGRVRNLSSRNILGGEINKDGSETKSYNLPKVLAGERQVYFNHVYKNDANECGIIEGQADAITLGQWGFAAVAVVGTEWKDHERFLGELQKRHKVLYLGMDADAAGLKVLVGKEHDWPLAKVLGPMVRLVNWRGIADGIK